MIFKAGVSRLLVAAKTPFYLEISQGSLLSRMLRLSYCFLICDRAALGPYSVYFVKSRKMLWKGRSLNVFCQAEGISPGLVGTVYVTSGGFLLRRSVSC